MDRRECLRFLAAGGAVGFGARALAQPAAVAPLERAIASTGEKIPAVGLGTWLTFDAGADPAARAVRAEVLRRFFAAGGRLIDSSPMYESSEEVLGATMPGNAPLFAASKVWTVGGLAGRRQVEQSRKLWRIARFDLLEVHNFLDWELHLPMLQAMKSEGRLRYVGVTTSHGRRHDLAEHIMRTRKIDFVQFTYNVAQRGVERDLLPLAADKGIAVIVNRPFEGGELFGAKTANALPGWARELQCETWAEAFLRFVVSHPAVTCAIPATSKPQHLLQNMRALAGPLPDAKLRERIAADYALL
jgi:diketogulonate reductase-like aldo/keto reductase